MQRYQREKKDSLQRKLNGIFQFNLGHSWETSYYKYAIKYNHKHSMKYAERPIYTRVLSPGIQTFIIKNNIQLKTGVLSYLDVGHQRCRLL